MKILILGVFICLVFHDVRADGNGCIGPKLKDAIRRCQDTARARPGLIIPAPWEKARGLDYVKAKPGRFLNTCAVLDVGILDEFKNFNQMIANEIAEETNLPQREKAQFKENLKQCVRDHRPDKLSGPLLECVGNFVYKICSG